MSVAPSTPRPRSRRNPILSLSHVFKPLVLRFAGTSIFPLYGVLEHRGRRSGTLFHTPVVVRPTHDGFVVPMPWGETTDWYRNVRAAGECRMRWKGRDYLLDRPEVLDTATARDEFSGFQRMAMKRLGIARSLRLHTVSS